MKKIVFTLTVIMSLGIAPILASNSVVVDKEFSSKKYEFMPIAVRDIPRHIQEILAMGFADFTVVSAEVEMENNVPVIYRVTLLDPENIELSVVVSAKGEILE